MAGPIVRIYDAVFVRYLLASGIALACDVSMLAALVALGIPAGAAATAAYALGIVVHWLVTSRAVFREEVETAVLGRTRQKVLFVLSALVGMGMTASIVNTGVGLGVPLVLIKTVAVGTSFFTSWYLRRQFIFRSRSTA